MFWIILILVVVLIVLYAKGVFRKPGECKYCNKTVKGTEQDVFGKGETKFCLCKDCSGKVHKDIKYSVENKWTYEDYTDYLAWKEETKDLADNFKVTHSYGKNPSLLIDADRGLFSFGVKNTPGLIYRFSDVKDFDINFKPEKLDEGVFNSTVEGKTYAMIEMFRPNVCIENVFNYGQSCVAKKKGIISSKYSYVLPDDFMEIIRVFSIEVYIASNVASNNTEDASITNLSEIEKALALFMFENIDDVTEEKLKSQRNTLMKAFHPDNNEDNVAYSQKINAAYEVLCGLLEK